MDTALTVRRLGLVDYAAAWQLQRELAAARAAETIGDTLLLLEHPPTYTFGSRGKREHLLVPADELRAAGVAVLDVDRGGDITFHGPGQLVAYPILRLRRYGLGVVQYLRALEDVLIGVCAGYGLEAGRIRGYTGAWVGDSKVAAIGAKLDVQGITRHGCALNVTTDLAWFAKMIPCGIQDKAVSSLAALLGRDIGMDDAAARFEAAFRGVFVAQHYEEQHG